MEEQSYTKLYHSAGWRDIIIDLSSKALQVWTYINFDLDNSKDYYWVNTSHLISKLKLKNNKELNDLIDNQLIRYALLSKTTIQDVYWINPAISFCGNRIKKYSKNINIR